MTLNDPNESLAEKLGITEADVRERKKMLDIGPEEATELLSLRPAIAMVVQDVIDEFYRFQLEVPAIRAIIGDTDTLLHLKHALRTYVMELFSGEYGIDYVKRRLRAGRVHGRIGVPPKFYVSAIYRLIRVIGAKLEPHTGSAFPPPSLRRLLLFDLELTIDTYIHGLLAQVDASKEALAEYSRQLEALVEERTEQIHALSRIDTLTGLGNRSALLEALEEACRKAAKGEVGFCLLFLDLDGFKKVNDTEGHAAGDDVLRNVGQLLKRSCRAADRIFRYGGDEFCVILPELGAEGALQMRGRLDEIVRNSSSGRFGLSSGWSLVAAGRETDTETILREADAAMYEDKKSRRKRAKPDPRQTGGTGAVPADMARD